MSNSSEKLRGNIKKVSEGILTAPKRLITANISTGAVDCKDAGVLRVRVTAQTFIAFGKSSLGVVSATTDHAIELPAAGTYMIAVTGDYVRASANPARVEVL